MCPGLPKAFAARQYDMTVARQFAGLSPADMPDATHIVCTADAKAPDNFGGIWLDLSAFEPEAVVGSAELHTASLMLVLCDVFDQRQLAKVRHLLLWLNTSESDTPMALLPLSMKSADKDGPTFAKVLKTEESLTGTCLDDVILGEPTGFALAFAVHTSLSRTEAKAKAWLDRLLTRTQNANMSQEMKIGIEHTLWHYVPQRLHIGLPAVDYNLGDEDGRQVAGYTIRRRLSLGADEHAFEVDPPNGMPQTPAGEIVKVLAKSSMPKTVDAVKRVQRTWQILQSLSGRWQHPNIVRSYQLYHAPMHIYVRMEHCGTESLYQRLQSRSKGSKTLTPMQVRSLVLQLSDALNHLHTGPRICHRDLKPESCGLTVGKDGVLTLKLINFDTSVVQRPGSKCKLKSGTFPFVAPEVASHKYDGMAADMWSLGVLLLEIACGIGVVERSLLGEGAGDAKDPEMQAFPLLTVRRVRDAFLADSEFTQKILAASGVPEVETILSWYSLVASKLLQVCPKQRWTSEQLFRVAKVLPLQSDIELEEAIALVGATESSEPSEAEVVAAGAMEGQGNSETEPSTIDT